MKLLFQFLIAIYAILITSNAGAWEYSIVPAGVRLEGVGGIYGLAAQAKHRDFSILGGAAEGEVQAQGVLIAGIPSGWRPLSFSFAYANLGKARFATNYSRGLKGGQVFEQEISGNGLGLSADFQISEHLKTSLGITQTHVSLEDYFIGDTRIPRPNTGGYHDVNTEGKFLRLEWNAADVERTRGLVASASATTQEGRVGQSDTFVFTETIAGYWPLSDRIVLAGRILISDSGTTSKKFADATAVSGALNTNCSSLTDPEQLSHCQMLESALVDYIAANNRFGTALPIGGGSGLRAYDELSLRAAHTRVLSIEPRVEITRRQTWTLSATPFYDLGWGADRQSDVFKSSVDSYGVGLRLLAQNMPVRLTYAQSRSQSAWFLAIGQTF